MQTLTQHAETTRQPRAGTAGRWLVLDKVGAIGAFLAAAMAPYCFPLLAAVGAALGLSSLQSARGYTDYTIQGMVVLALVGDVVAFRQHHQRGPLVVGLAAAGVAFFVCFVPTATSNARRFKVLAVPPLMVPWGGACWSIGNMR